MIVEPQQVGQHRRAGREPEQLFELGGGQRGAGGDEPFQEPGPQPPGLVPQAFLLLAQAGVAGIAAHVGRHGLERAAGLDDLDDGVGPVGPDRRRVRPDAQFGGFLRDPGLAEPFQQAGVGEPGHLREVVERDVDRGGVTVPPVGAEPGAPFGDLPQVRVALEHRFPVGERQQPVRGDPVERVVLDPLLHRGPVRAERGADRFAGRQREQRPRSVVSRALRGVPDLGNVVTARSLPLAPRFHRRDPADPQQRDRRFQAEHRQDHLGVAGGQPQPERLDRGLPRSRGQPGDELQPFRVGELRPAEQDHVVLVGPGGIVVEGARQGHVILVGPGALGVEGAQHEPQPAWAPQLGAPARRPVAPPDDLVQDVPHERQAVGRGRVGRDRRPQVPVLPERAFHRPGVQGADEVQGVQAAAGHVRGQGLERVVEDQVQQAQVTVGDRAVGEGLGAEPPLVDELRQQVAARRDGPRHVQQVGRVGGIGDRERAVVHGVEGPDDVSDVPAQMAAGLAVAGVDVLADLGGQRA
ncbi:hypothetical protein KZZ52_38560 [Dactylosporangium sp. AC04546]|nr:hypothetical protein [Dactylosporangium sp. AC04546]WVK79859.1 hypothetical protein KZZ52_38560 [Dactylosporangium sp. AC04546]